MAVAAEEVGFSYPELGQLFDGQTIIQASGGLVVARTVTIEQCVEPIILSAYREGLVVVDPLRQAIMNELVRQQITPNEQLKVSYRQNLKDEIVVDKKRWQLDADEIGIMGVLVNNRGLWVDSRSIVNQQIIAPHRPFDQSKLEILYAKVRGLNEAIGKNWVLKRGQSFSSEFALAPWVVIDLPGFTAADKKEARRIVKTYMGNVAVFTEPPTDTKNDSAQEPNNGAPEVSGTDNVANLGGQDDTEGDVATQELKNPDTLLPELVLEPVFAERFTILDPEEHDAANTQAEAQVNADQRTVIDLTPSRLIIDGQRRFIPDGQRGRDIKTVLNAIINNRRRGITRRDVTESGVFSGNKRTTGAKQVAFSTAKIWLQKSIPFNETSEYSEGNSSIRKRIRLSPNAVVKFSEEEPADEAETPKPPQKDKSSLQPSHAKKSPPVKSKVVKTTQPAVKKATVKKVNTTSQASHLTTKEKEALKQEFMERQRKKVQAGETDPKTATTSNWRESGYKREGPVSKDSSALEQRQATREMVRQFLETRDPELLSQLAIADRRDLRIVSSDLIAEYNKDAIPPEVLKAFQAIQKIQAPRAFEK